MKLIRFIIIALLFGIASEVSSQTNVSWTDTTGVLLSGDTIIKYAPTSWTNGSAASQNVLLAGQNGWVKAGISGISGKVVIGLTAINVSSNYRTFDFAILIKHSHLYIYEKGILKVIAGSASLGDSIKIQRVGSTILYEKNGMLLYTSYAPTGNPIVYSEYAGSLEAVVSLYDSNSHLKGMKCSFSRNIFVGGIVNPQLGPDSLGSTYLKAYVGHSPYQYIWNGIRYPFRNQFRPFLDSLIRVDTLSVDTTAIFHQMDSLRQDRQDNYENSGIYRGTVIDSIFDTTSINSEVGETVTWINNIGFTINNVKTPRVVEYLPQDSLSSLIEGQPNLSEPVTCYSDSGIDLYKTASTGWSSGEATSINNLSYNDYGKVSFVIPDISSVQVAGLKMDTIPDVPGYSDILYGFYLQRDSVGVYSNGSFIYAGKYRAGDMFSIENTYDSVRHLQRILFKQQNKLLKIAYINRLAFSGRMRYRFKSAIHTHHGAIISTHIIGIGWWMAPWVTANIQPASCGFPSSGAISLNFLWIPPGWTITSYLWSNGATTSSISNISPGQYHVSIKFFDGTFYHTYTYGYYDVGYKIYWADLGNARMMGAGNTNSIYQTGPVPSGGNSSNGIKYTAPILGMSWIEFNAGNSYFPPPLFGSGEMTFGYTSVDGTYNNSDITYGLYLYKIPPIVMAIGKGFPFFRFKLGTTNKFMIAYDNPGFAMRVYWNDIFQQYNGVLPTTANYIVKATLNHFGILGITGIYDGLCSFGCPDMNFPYATLTKTLDGSYYISPYGNLSFKYDEEYVDNGNGLPYTIYDMQHNIMYQSTLPPTAYKDNYYSIDLTAINSAICNGWFILQVTNKKGEVTELRFKN